MLRGISHKESVLFEYRSKVLAVVNQKGGVGKTTTVTVLAEFGASIWRKPDHFRVLVIDLDMQCNTSDYFVGMEMAAQERGGQLPPIHPDFDGSDDLSERSTIADTYYGKMVLPHTVSLNGHNKGEDVTLDIIVGHPKELEDINEKFNQLTGEIDSKVINRLGELLHCEEVASSYDLIILDTGPSRNPIFRSALRAATDVVVPFEPEEKSLQGVNSMAQAITSENFNRKNKHPKIKVAGLLPNKVRISVPLHKNYLNKIKTSLPALAMPDGVYLPLSVAFPKRDVKGANPQSIFNLKPSENARKKAEVVCNYVYNKVFSDEKEIVEPRTEKLVEA